MASIVASLPLQLLCQLIASNSSSNISQIDITTVEQPQLEIESTTGAPSVKQSSLPPGYVAYPKIGFAFKVHTEPATFPEAEKRCKKEGGHLATIDSEKKLVHAMALGRTRASLLHVGILKMYGREWIGVGTGLPVDVLWAPDEPNNDGLCVAIAFTLNGMGAFDCYNENAFICELPISQENSTVKS